MPQNPKTQYDRGRIITYDRVPDDVYDLILKKQLQIKTTTKRGKVSMGDAITKLIREASADKIQRTVR